MGLAGQLIYSLRLACSWCAIEQTSKRLGHVLSLKPLTDAVIIVITDELTKTVYLLLSTFVVEHRARLDGLILYDITRSLRPKFDVKQVEKQTLLYLTRKAERILRAEAIFIALFHNSVFPQFSPAMNKVTGDAAESRTFGNQLFKHAQRHILTPVNDVINGQDNDNHLVGLVQLQIP